MTRSRSAPGASSPAPPLAAVVEAPWGPIHLATTARGVMAVALSSTREAFAGDLERRLGVSPRWLGSADEREGAAGGHLADAIRAISSVLAGHDTKPRGGTAETMVAASAALVELPLDLGDRPAWDRLVLDAVRAIPPGETRSYGEIARAIGRPGAARAVGGAVGRNPVGFLIPCHRVIAGDGTLGGYGGGWWGERDRLLELKAELLAAEGVSVRRGPSGADRRR